MERTSWEELQEQITKLENELQEERKKTDPKEIRARQLAQLKKDHDAKHAQHCRWLAGLSSEQCRALALAKGIKEELWVANCSDDDVETTDKELMEVIERILDLDSD